MNAAHGAPIASLESPLEILAQATKLVSTDQDYFWQPLIQRFGSPLQPIYVDKSKVEIGGIEYDNPLILPIYDGQLELLQCAFLQDGRRVQILPNGLAQGFARYGRFDHAEPIIVTYSLEAFFKIAQTGYAVALVLLPTLCNAKQAALKAFDFEQMQFVIHQLSKAGYTKLYLPARPE